MALITYLLRADLRRRWRSLAVLTLLVAIVVGAVLTAVAGARRTETAFDRYLDGVGPIDAFVVADGDPVDPARIAAIDGVDGAVGLTWYVTQPKADRDGLYPAVVPGDARVPNQYLRYPVVKGRRADPRAPLEVDLGERTARRLGVQVGDTVPLDTYSIDQDYHTALSPRGPHISLAVVGIVRDPGDIAGRETDVDLTFLTPAFAKMYGPQLAVFAHFVVLDLAPGTSLASVTRGLDRLGGLQVDNTGSPEALRTQVDPTLASMANGLRIMALALALTGFFTIVQALARATTEQAEDHDALRSLGATDTTLWLRLTAPNAAAAGLGALLGAAASVLLSPLLPVGLARRAEPDPGLHVDAAVLLAGVLGAVALTLVAAATVAAITLRRERSATRRAPRPSHVADAAAGLGAPLPVVSGMRLAFDPGRGRRTIPVRAAGGAAALGAIGVLAAVVFGSSLHHAVVTPQVYGWGWDASLEGVQGDQVSDGQVDEASLTADRSFSAVAEYIQDLQVTVDGAPDRGVTLEDLRGHTSFVIVRGVDPTAYDEVAVGGRTLDKLGIDIGDTVDVSAGGPARPLRVVGVVALPVAVDGGTSTEGIAMSRAAADATGFSGSCDGDAAACSRNYVVTAAPGVDALTAAKRHASPGVVQAVLPSPPAEVARLTAVQDLPRLLAGVLGVIAIVAVTHAATVTVRRRRHDLALLRVLGYSGRQLRATVAVQVAALSLSGAAAGTVVGVVLGRQIWTAVARGVPLPVVVTMPPAAILAVPLTIVVLSHAGATLARVSAGRIRAGQALRTE